jgi:hypothetical protein
MKNVVLLLFFLQSIYLNAQPVLTRNNFFFIGDSTLVHTKFDASLLTFSPGSSGVNTTWNFSSMDFTHPSVYTDTVIFMDPVGTPYFPSSLSADYSGANICYLVKTDPTSPNNLDYNYCYADTDSLAFIGHWANSGGSDLWEDHCSDPIRLLSFPISYGDTFTDSFERFYFDMSGSDGHWITGSNSVTADGYGTLIDPGGNTLTDVLRIHSVESVRDSNALFGITYRTQHNYYWYDMNQHGYVLRLEMGADSTEIISAYYQRQTNIVTAIETSGISLNRSSIFPNPCNGHFRYDAPYEAMFAMEIYTEAGQLVKTIQTYLHKGVNDLDFTFLSPGMYYLKILNCYQIIEKKLVVDN